MTKLLLLIFVVIGLPCVAQVSINGKVLDTSDNRALQNAVVSVINPSDSILLKFTRTKADGSFQINDLPPGKLIVMITFPNYADFVDQLRDSTTREFSFGSVPLTKKSELLEAVIVQRKLSAIRMRGDTLAYVADSFAVRQGATVDELLKQLPGIQVDRNGAITAQGEKVNKVLVDGEEFFSDDPAVVTKNLQAEAVKEVQVYDKKSDQAEFTGIDDGERSKTINLTLKPEKKKGYFGKASLNGGTNSSFDNDLMFNYFKGTRKIAAFGIMSNTGRQGLGWDEMEKFGGGNNVNFNEEEGYMFVGGGDDEFSQESNYEDGLPAAWSAGLHFSDKWKNESQKVNGNYRFLKKNLNTEGTTRTQYILPDTQYFNDQARKIFNSKTGHQVKAISEMKLDSLSDIKITIKGSLVRNQMASRLQSRALNADSGLVNTNDRLLSSITDNNNFNADVLWRKKFRKKGRTLSVNLQQQSSYNKLDGVLQSTTNYFEEDNNTGTEIIDQKKDNRRSILGAKANFVYTEPLSKTLFVSVNYGLNYLKTDASRNSFNKGGSDVYDKVDSLFTNDFDYRYLIQSTGLDFRINRKKTMFLVGSGMSFSDYRQADLIKDTATRYSFTNFYPKVVFRFSPKQYSNIAIRYNGNNNPPSLEQLQPVRENTDPLNIQLGNPNLRQEFVHTVSVNGNTYRVMSETGMYMGAYVNIYDNAISTSSNVDEGGKRTTIPINVKGNYSINAYGGYQTKIKGPDIRVGLNSYINSTKQSNLVNGFKNATTATAYGISLYLNKSKNDKYSIGLRPGIGYTFNKSTIRPDVVTRYFTGETSGDLWVRVLKKFEIWSQAIYSYRQKTDVFGANRNVVRWDASLSRKFMKNNNLEMKVSVFDLLNQNIGFDRSASSNFITETTFNSLRRRFMIGIQYNITKNPG